MEPLRRASSFLFGVAADLPLPGFLRGTVYRGYAAITGADLEEAAEPLRTHRSLGEFFVRGLREGVRPVDPDPTALVSPVDGAVQQVSPIENGSVLQAKGRPYPLRELLAGVGEDLDLDGGHAWTLYLSPRDYHRIHAPEAGRLVEARWAPGLRFSVAPKVLERHLVLPLNERCVTRIETARGPLLLVLVGALNVSRMQVVGTDRRRSGPLAEPVELARGQELGRFELGSTVVLVAPPGGPVPTPGLEQHVQVRVGRAIGRWPA